MSEFKQYLNKVLCSEQTITESAKTDGEIIQAAIDDVRRSKYRTMKSKDRDYDKFQQQQDSKTFVTVNYDKNRRQFFATSSNKYFDSIIKVIDNEIAKHVESLKTYYRTKGVGINLSAHNIITPLGFEVSPALKVDRDDLGWPDKQQVHVGMIRMYFIK